MKKLRPGDPVRASPERLAPDQPRLLDETVEVVVPKLISPGVPVLEGANMAFHRMLVRGRDVQVRREGGVRGDICQLVGVEDPQTPQPPVRVPRQCPAQSAR